jgi:DNA-binding NarL/FixJ family response regulator
MLKVASDNCKGDILMHKLRILVADDHGDMRWATIRLLSEEFDVVGSAADGRNLVDAAITLIPDVIVSDVGMPLLNGPEAMAVLRATGVDVPFVFVSADPTRVEECIEAGAMGFVLKTDMGHELTRAVGAANRREIYLSRGALSADCRNYASTWYPGFRKEMSAV